MTDLRLKTVTRTQGNNQALKDGTVRPTGFGFAFEEVNPLIRAFRAMVPMFSWPMITGASDGGVL